MSRFIDYDAIDYKNYNMIGKSQEFMKGVVYMAERIEEAPGIDICFCRDCKKRDDDYVCYKWASVDECPQVRPDDFCSYGQRKESE